MAFSGRIGLDETNLVFWEEVALNLHSHQRFLLAINAAKHVGFTKFALR